MRTPCTVVLDSPVKILFWEFEEFFLFTGSPFVGLHLIGPGLAFGGAGVLALLSYVIKRGKPQGALFHLLHRELAPLISLPGILPPQPQRYGSWVSREWPC